MHQYLAENPDDHDQLGYITGEAIEITARFTGDVTTINPDTGQQADHAGIYILVDENRRFASYLRNHGGDAFRLRLHGAARRPGLRRHQRRGRRRGCGVAPVL